MNPDRRPRRRLRLLLILIAVGVWSTVGYRAMTTFRADPPEEPDRLEVNVATAHANEQTPRPVYHEASRDPFIPPWAVPKPAARQPSAQDAADTKPPPVPPALRLSGIIGTTALLEQGDAAPHLAHPGDELVDANGQRIVVETVAPEHVELRAAGHRYTYRLPTPELP